MFGSGAATQIGTFNSRRTASGFGPRTTTFVRDSASVKACRAGPSTGRLDERPRAHAGEEDDDVELAGDESRGEVERGGIGFERNFAKGGRGNRAAAVIRNQR